MPRVCSCKSTLSSAIYLSVYGKTDLFIHLSTYRYAHMQLVLLFKRQNAGVHLYIYIHTYLPTYVHTYIHRIHADTVRMYVEPLRGICHRRACLKMYTQNSTLSMVPLAFLYPSSKGSLIWLSATCIPASHSATKP